MKLDRAPLDWRVEQGLITRKQKGDLWLYNYTQKCQWERQWDKWTMMARGLILRTDGTVVARPYQRFFNVGEVPQTFIANLPTYKPEVTEKLDGSLGIFYWEGGQPTIATRGSFESEQALWATEWIRSQGIKKTLKNMTYLFEIIYPENRVVVDYGDIKSLFLIGLVHNYTGIIQPLSLVTSEADRLGLPCVRQSSMDLSTILTHEQSNFEGFVLFYPEDNLMVKVKLPEYRKLHKLIFGLSEKAVIETILSGLDPVDYYKEAPDEILDWIRGIEGRFNGEVSRLTLRTWSALDHIKELPTRKDKALYLKKHYPNVIAFVFKALDGKDWKGMIYDWVLRRWK